MTEDNGAHPDDDMTQADAAWLALARAQGQRIIMPKDAPTLVRVITLLQDMWKSPDEMHAWLSLPHPSLDGEIPIALIEAGRAMPWSLFSKTCAMARTSDARPWEAALAELPE